MSDPNARTDIRGWCMTHGRMSAACGCDEGCNADALCSVCRRSTPDHPSPASPPGEDDLDLGTVHVPRGPLTPACPPEHREQAAVIASLRAEIQRERKRADSMVGSAELALRSARTRAEIAEREREAAIKSHGLAGVERDDAAARADDRERLWHEATRRADAAEQRLREVEGALPGLLDELDRVEAWRIAVADGLGFMNRPEGQSGCEVAEPSVILAALRTAEALALERLERATRLEEALREIDGRLNEPGEEIGTAEWCVEMDNARMLNRSAARSALSPPSPETATAREALESPLHPKETRRNGDSEAQAMASQGLGAGRSRPEEVPATDCTGARAPLPAAPNKGEHMPQPPSTGRIVHYKLRPEDVEAVNRRRVAKPHDPGWPAGAQAHIGNSAVAGEVVPLIIVRVWPNEYGDQPGVNGQALLDGNDSLWITSAKEGTEPGQWMWPPRV